MTLKTRVIPCLDVRDGQVVKGVHFSNLQEIGDPVALAKKYYNEGADEITFLDVSASLEGRGTMLEIVKQTADQVFIPLTVGGGVRSVKDVDALLRAGADKVSLNTAAIKRPEVINEIAQRFGRQVVVLSVDAKRAADHTLERPHYIVTTHGGKQETAVDALEWIVEASQRGAGEILLNSMDKDGTKSGFDIKMINNAKKVSHLPLIASGGAGKLADFEEVLEKTPADAVLAASVFHYGEIGVREVRDLVDRVSDTSGAHR